jgi:DNA mismatch repair protein MSH2
MHPLAADFNTKDVESDLRRLLGTGLEQHQSQLERAHALSCLPPLIRHLDLLSSVSGGGDSSSSSSSSSAASPSSGGGSGSVRFKLKSFDVAGFMRLDKAAVRALNLFPSATDSNKAQSLLGLLNRCKTAMGQRLLAQWLKQPLLQLPAIERRLDFVEAFVDDTQLRQSLHEARVKLKTAVRVCIAVLREFTHHFRSFFFKIPNRTHSLSPRST